MTTFLAIVIVILMIMVVYSLVRGIVAFLQDTKLDLERDETSGPTANQLLQNKMMFARIKWQALAIVVVALVIAISK
jgi:succinate dehydrogenase/fumarate reductase cytochrome b subunit